MPHHWTCPVCKTAINLDDVTADGKVRCPSCGTEFTAGLRRSASEGGGGDSEGGAGREA